MSRVLISAAHKSSGKTTVTAGICAALRQRNLDVQTFKKGPDYIDPMWLASASGNACHNLDFHTMTGNEIHSVFQRYSIQKDISVIEGNKGLYDGVDLEGSNSNAALAKVLKTPVVLVIDARGMTRGVAPLLLGYLAFDQEIEIKGVILNKLGGSRHEQKLRNIVEHYTDIPMIGAVHHDPKMEIDERHLGLIPSNESEFANQTLDYLAQRINAQVNLDQFIEIAGTAEKQNTTGFIQPVTTAKHSVKIGVAQDSAFGFYYQGDLEALERAGAEIVPVNTLHDSYLPELDGLIIGGGFPETQADKLEANDCLRREIKTAIENGMPCYAECGGMMYLSRSLQWHDKTWEMVGVIQADTVMHSRPQGRGYMRLEKNANYPWPEVVNPTEIPNTGKATNSINAHEFHYSNLQNIDPALKFAYDVKRGHGITGSQDGIVYKNLFASYAHQRDVSTHNWAEQFVNFVANCRNRQTTPYITVAR